MNPPVVSESLVNAFLFNKRSEGDPSSGNATVCDNRTLLRASLRGYEAIPEPQEVHGYLSLGEAPALGLPRSFAAVAVTFFLIKM